MESNLDLEFIFRRYLLGHMAEAERAEWEDNYFADDAQYERLSIVEEELVDEYVCGKLSPDEKAQFETVEIMTDTGAYTDVVFGLFWLLGYRFCPRIADIGGARYWRVDAAADYGPLNRIACHRINTKLIEENWDDM